jgi:hypothetical protein
MTQDDLMSAIKRGDARAVRRILARTPQRRDEPRFGDTRPLHWAAHVNGAVVSALLDAGADVNPVDDDRRTPLHHAARESVLSAATVLIRRGADVNAVDALGFTPLTDALLQQTPQGKAIAERLQRAGARLDLVAAACLADVGRVKELLAEDPGAALAVASVDLLLSSATAVLGYGTIEDRVAILGLLFTHGITPENCGRLLRYPSELHSTLRDVVRNYCDPRRQR